MSKVKLYTETEIIPEGVPHTFMLIPFLGIHTENSSDPDVGRFTELKEKGTTLFELTKDPNASDYFLLPFGYSFDPKQQPVIKSFFQKAQAHNKKTLVFYNADDDAKITHENVIVFRTSFNASTRNTYEYALPGWSLDFKHYMKDHKLNYLPKEEKPSVSYCGYIDHHHDSLFRKIRRTLELPIADHETKAKAIRGKACRNLSRNQLITSNFIFRNGFWAAGMTDKVAARKEYAQNMINSVYAIVTRGGGNFSYRLYEVLSCGRIPLFIYTDSVLPFDQDIKWKEHLIWLDVNDCDKIDEILLDFHKATSNEKLAELQKSNRELYENYLSPFGFFKHLHHKLLNKEF